MKALLNIFAIIMREQRVSLMRSAVLSLLVLIMGAALLGLSGWFITAAAAAGMAGLGAVFDVFRPSAMVRFFALGRAVARYGERVLSHEATLQALEAIRIHLLNILMIAPYKKMVRIRGAQALNRLTADIDALDGISLRLILPIVAGFFAHIFAFALLWSFVSSSIALWVSLGYLVGIACIFWWTARNTIGISRQTEAASQAFRARFIDLIRARRDLTIYGQLLNQSDHVMAADKRRIALQAALDRADRITGATIQFLVAIVTGCALWLGILSVQSGKMEPAFAALGFFVAMALVEAIAPLRRAATDLGRMVDAARRVSRAIDAVPELHSDHNWVVGPLVFDAVTLHRPGTNTAIIKEFCLRVEPGGIIALTGLSGVGKSTLLLAAAALHPVSAGSITIGGVSADQFDENTLRDNMTLVPQRSKVMAGTIRDSLLLARPDCSEENMHAALSAVLLSETIAKRGGLNALISGGGEGFSGGEIRRLALARALLRQPNVLLLDEPTEGLDELTAQAVLTGIRTFLPHASILIAAHRKVETQFADRVIALELGYIKNAS